MGSVIKIARAMAKAERANQHIERDRKIIAALKESLADGNRIPKLKEIAHVIGTDEKSTSNYIDALVRKGIIRIRWGTGSVKIVREL